MIKDERTIAIEIPPFWFWKEGNFSIFFRVSLKKKGSYYGKTDIKKILIYKKISNINLIKKVISIWGGIVLIKDNKKFFITKISDSGNISRISHYPVVVYKMLSFLKN